MGKAGCNQKGMGKPGKETTITHRNWSVKYGTTDKNNLKAIWVKIGRYAMNDVELIVDAQRFNYVQHTRLRKELYHIIGCQDKYSNFYLDTDFPEWYNIYTDQTKFFNSIEITLLVNQVDRRYTYEECIYDIMLVVDLMIDKLEGIEAFEFI